MLAIISDEAIKGPVNVKWSTLSLKLGSIKTQVVYLHDHENKIFYKSKQLSTITGIPHFVREYDNHAFLRR
jgi:hypothetical protein